MITEQIKKGGLRMTREMEYTKCVAVLCKLYRMGRITESEFHFVKEKLKTKYLILEDTNNAA